MSPETKPFYLTSEFYVTVGTIAAALAGAFPVGGRTATLVVAVSGGAYAISRGLAKSGVEPIADTSLEGDPDDTLGGSDHPA